MLTHVKIGSAYSAVAREQATPEAQAECLLERNKGRAGVEVNQSAIPSVPTGYVPQSPTELLLLKEVHPPAPGVTMTARSVTRAWNAIEGGKHLDLKAGSWRDSFGSVLEPGYTWVAFDPCGLRIEEEAEFRPNVFIRRARASNSQPFPGLPEIEALAGIEVFTALSTVPLAMNEVWARGRNQVAPGVIIPRLSALSTDGRYGVVELKLAREGLECWVRDWDYGHYGQHYVIPTVRALG